MDIKKFSAFKYTHKGQSDMSAQRWRLVKITLVMALVASVAFFPAGAFSFLAPILIYFSAPKMLYIGPRYLICGDTIIYFFNVKAMILEDSSGILRLVPTNGRDFLIERDNFPTNARKTAKIATNKAKKFDKVSSKLIEKVLKVSPDVVLNGIDRGAHSA
jgi:hypothetical protein